MKKAKTFLRNYWLHGCLLSVSCITAFSSNAQDYKTNDTVHVNEIVISGESISRFQSGAKIEKIPTKQFEIARDGNLEQLLSRNTPIFLKANAGAFSTIRIRGTAPDHTSINFGGININSLTLGHSNVSNVPMYLFDELGIQFGSSSTVNGSGSIGGAIYLGIKNNWTKGVKSEVKIAHGSFGEQLYGAKIYLGNEKFETVTRAYYYSKANNFKFKNTTIKDFETDEIGVADTQHNAIIENMGLIQELNYKFNHKEYISLQVWLENDWHQVQQNMATNYKQPNMADTLDDSHARVWAKYQNRKKAFKYQIAGGYAYDKSLYNNNIDDKVQTQRIIGEGTIEHDFSENASYKVGVKAMRIYPKVYAYPVSLEHEDRIDLHASYYHNFFNKLKATINLRQAFVSNFSIPFTPSVGLNYKAISKEKYVISFIGNIAKSYRVPTFNDRYWVPGGNPDLDPENGITYELGTKYSYCNTQHSGNIKATAFYMDVDDWILWKPGGSDSIHASYWYAENVQKVESKGIEIMADIKYPVAFIKMHSGINYALTSTQRKKSENNTNALDRQLEYVPLHSANFYTTATYKDLDITLDGSYTHKQFTNEEEEDILDPYFLFNISCIYNIILNNNNKFRINGMLSNLFNKDYQSYYGYAMPGINYRLSLTYNFK